MKRSLPWFVLLIGILVLSSLACNFSSFMARPTIQPTETLAPTQTAVPTPIAFIDSNIALENVLVNIYQQVSPGVVFIQILDDTGGAQGSGFVYDTLGHIITNYHVVENATEIEVDFPSGIKVHGTVVGKDTDSDIAVIKVDVPPDQLTPLRMGDSDAAQVGQMVIAIGNPYGLTGTMTTGIVSAKGRTLDAIRMTEDGNPYSSGDIIQTDASINPGNSGGPLLNLDGEVIGINRAIQTSGVTSTGDPVNTGIGFAVSINIVKRVVPFLISQGYYDYPYLGLSCRPEISLIEQEILELGQSTGAYVVAVTPGGPAEAAGIKAGSQPTQYTNLLAGGDLIVAIDDRPVNIFGDLLSYLMTSKSPGDTVVLTVLRDGQQKEVSITLEKRP